MKKRIVIVLAGLCLAGCGGPKESATKAARDEVGNPDARVEALREHWTPTYQNAVCGRIQVGVEQRRFVALLTSDGEAASAIVEGPKIEEKQMFEEVTWRPICGF